MSKFRKKPVVIDAFQWQGDFDALDAWLVVLGCGDGEDPETDVGPMWENTDGTLTVLTLEGEHLVGSHGDWIIRGVKGEFYPCRADIFALTYESVQVADDVPESPTPLEMLKDGRLSDPEILRRWNAGDTPEPPGDSSQHSEGR